MRALLTIFVVASGLLSGCTGSDPHAGSLGGNASASPATHVFPTEDPAANPPPTNTTSTGRVHWHALFQLWLNGERVRFATSDGRFYYDDNRQAQFLPAHIHACNPDLIHNEATSTDPGKLVQLFDVDFAFAGGKLTDTQLVVPQGAPLAGTYTASANDSLALYVSHANGNWTQQTRIEDYAFHDGDRILLVFGHDAADSIRQRADNFPLFERAALC